MVLRVHRPPVGSVPIGYGTEISLEAASSDPNPNPTVTWSTNQPSLLQLVPEFMIGGISYYTAEAIGPSFTYPQSPPANYNISVTVTRDGVKSAPFPIFINIPYANYVVNTGQYCSAFDKCDCNAAGFYSGYTGYVTLNNVYTEDLFGNYLTRISTNETLFNQLWLGTGGWTSSLGNPKQSNWSSAQWNSGYSFPDYYSFCTSTPSSFTPPPTYSGSGGTEFFTETQNYWIESTTNGWGLCTQASAADLYTNHGAQSNVQPPAYPAAVCANRTNLNTAP